MTPEFRTLLACARMRPEASSIRSALRAGFDHARFLSLAAEHAVTPLVYRSLKAACWDDMPPGFRAGLAARVTASAGRGRFLTAELIRLLQAVESAGIRAVPFKGPALAASAYGDIALREYTDLDIFVRQQDLALTSRILQDREYRQEPPERGAHAQSSAFLFNECQYHFWGNRDSTLVEIHWRMAQRYFDFPFPIETCWQNLVEAEVEGFRILAFSPEDQLLFLSVHGARHLWSSLNWVCDLAEHIRASPNLDWQLAFQQAGLARSERTLLLGLTLAHRLLDADLPPWVLARVENCSGFDAVIADIVDRLETLDDPGILRFARFHMARKAGIFQKLRQCAFVLACPTGGDWAAGPAPLPLLALRRPLRLLWKHR